MAQKTEKSYRSFIKGLITEANALTYPENASLDEDNFVINRDGSRSRRLGIDYEDLYNLIDSACTEEQIASSMISFYKWDSPSSKSDLSIGVIRVYNKLFFINLVTSNPSNHLLNQGNYLELEGLSNSEIQSANLNNQLVIVSKDFEKPYVLSYESVLDEVTWETIDLKVRDIWGLDDGLDADERPPVYDTKVWKGTGQVNIWLYYSYNGNTYQVVGFGPDITNYSTDTKKKSISKTDPIVEPTHTSGLAEEGGIIWKYIQDTAGLSPQHKYNLRNQGWKKTIQCDPAGDAIQVTADINDFYPSNADNWTLGKNTNPTSTHYEKYQPDRLKRNSHSNYQIARGSYIIDAFNRGTSRIEEVDDTGAKDLPLDKENGRLTTIASYAQRLFYSGILSDITDGDNRSPNYNNYIFFTKVVRSKDDIFKCYQEADPTDPGINSIVASDGGTIQIPEISRIIKIVAAQSSLVVFAENGIWEVFGDTGGFYANNFQVAKITSTGTFNQNSIVEVNGAFMYWSNSGIYALVPQAATGRYKAESVSLSTIQTFYLGIPTLGKKYCKGYYDEKENRVHWLYNDTDEYSETSYVNKYNKELIFDLTLQAFYKHSISSLETDSPYIADFVEIPAYVLNSTVTDIVVGTEKVIVTSTDQVIVDIEVSANRTSQFSFLTLAGTDITLSKYKNTSFIDWEAADGTGVDYSSYLLTGYELFNDTMKTKQVPYIFFYFNRTEDGYSTATGNLELTNPSSCLVQSQWNWTDSANSGKWGSTIQAYRILKNYIPSGASDPFDYGDSVIVTKNKLRGSGKSLSLKIQSEAGKDMQLLGWALSANMIDAV